MAVSGLLRQTILYNGEESRDVERIKHSTKRVRYWKAPLFLALGRISTSSSLLCGKKLSPFGLEC